jgi:hypothetical protein
MLKENSNSGDYLPKYLCTSSTTSTPSSTMCSLFNFCGFGNLEIDYHRVKVTTTNSESETLFDISRKTNDIQVGTFYDSSINEGIVKVGGYNLELSSKTGLKSIFDGSYNSNTITNDCTNFKIKENVGGSTISLKYGFTMLYTNTNVELTEKDSYNKVVISNGINLVIESGTQPLTIKFTNYK